VETALECVLRPSVSQVLAYDLGRGWRKWLANLPVPNRRCTG
jgi:hypothetical protein